MFKEVVILFEIARMVATAPSYQYQNFVSTSTASPTSQVNVYSSNNNNNNNNNGGYRARDSIPNASGNKVKKTYGSTEYLYPVENSKNSYNNVDFSSFDEYSSTPGPSVISFPYNPPYVASYPKAITPASVPSIPTQIQPTYFPKPVKEYPPIQATNKIYIPDDHITHEKAHLIHDILGNKIHVVTGIVGPKLKEVGYALQSGHLDDPILHKLAFGKAALLHLLGILGPLSAIKTLKLTSHPPHYDEHHGFPGGPSAPGPLVGPGPVIEDHIDHHDDHHYPLSPIAMLLNVIGHMSLHKVESKPHLFPNLVKVATYASGSASSSSSHPHHY